MEMRSLACTILLSSAVMHPRATAGVGGGTTQGFRQIATSGVLSSTGVALPSNSYPCPQQDRSNTISTKLEGYLIGWPALRRDQRRRARTHSSSHSTIRKLRIMLEQMPANRILDKKQCNIKDSKTELKSAVGNNSGIEIWDWNQMLRLHNNLHLKWHTRSNVKVQRRNGQQTCILTGLCSRFYTPLPDSDIPDALTRQSQKTRFRAMKTSTNKHHRAGGWVQNPDGCGHCINTALPSPEHPA